MIRAINVFVVIRILIGTIFIVSGLEKLIGPYQNFLYVIQGYEVLPPHLEELSAKIFPWVEFFVGVFLLLGLWVGFATKSAFLMVAVFIFFVSQALIRSLPITDCGCFGELISFPLYVVLCIDLSLISLLSLLIWKKKKVALLSLDSFFDKTN